MQLRSYYFVRLIFKTQFVPGFGRVSRLLRINRSASSSARPFSVCLSFGEISPLFSLMLYIFVEKIALWLRVSTFRYSPSIKSR